MVICITVQCLIGQVYSCASAYDEIQDVNRLYESARACRPKVWTDKISSYKQLSETYESYVTNLEIAADRLQVPIDGGNPKNNWVSAVRAKLERQLPSATQEGLRRAETARAALVEFSGVEQVEKLDSELPRMHIPITPPQAKQRQVGDFPVNHPRPIPQPGRT